MILIETYNASQLTHLIKTCWYLEVPANLPQPYQEDIVPDGHHEIILHVAPYTGKRRFKDGVWIEEPAAFIAGQTQTSYTVQLMPGAKLYGIRFYPHTLAAFLKMPVPANATGITPLGEVTQEAPFLRCLNQDTQQTFQALEQLLTGYIRKQDHRSNSYAYVHAAVQTILQRKGNVSVDQLLQRTGISARHLDALFKQQVGLTPKVVSNIIQFNHFISWKNRHPEQNYTRAGYEAGFYDQSHLIRTFHQYVQQSPTAYFSNQAWINDVFVEI